MKFIGQQKGYTLVELLIAGTIMTLIITALSFSIFNVLNVTRRGNATNAALSDIQSAAYWINHDAQMANTTNLISGQAPVNYLNLQWTDSEGVIHYCSFTLSGSELKRNYDGNINTLARYISSLEFSINGKFLNIYIKSSPAGKDNIVKYLTSKVLLRPSI